MTATNGGSLNQCISSQTVAVVVVANCSFYSEVFRQYVFGQSTYLYATGGT